MNRSQARTASAALVGDADAWVLASVGSDGVPKFCLFLPDGFAVESCVIECMLLRLVDRIRSGFQLEG